MYLRSYILWPPVIGSVWPHCLVLLGGVRVSVGPVRNGNDVLAVVALDVVLSVWPCRLSWLAGRETPSPFFCGFCIGSDAAAVAAGLVSQPLRARGPQHTQPMNPPPIPLRRSSQHPSSCLRGCCTSRACRCAWNWTPTRPTRPGSTSPSLGEGCPYRVFRCGTIRHRNLRFCSPCAYSIADGHEVFWE